MKMSDLVPDTLFMLPDERPLRRMTRISGVAPVLGGERQRRVPPYRPRHFVRGATPERRRAHVEPQHSYHHERHLDADPALARPVDVAQVDQEGELVDHEGAADPERDAEPGVVAR